MCSVRHEAHGSANGEGGFWTPSGASLQREAPQLLGPAKRNGLGRGFLSVPEPVARAGPESAYWVVTGRDKF